MVCRTVKRPILTLAHALLNLREAPANHTTPLPPPFLWRDGESVFLRRLASTPTDFRGSSSPVDFSSRGPSPLHTGHCCRGKTRKTTGRPSTGLAAQWQHRVQGDLLRPALSLSRGIRPASSAQRSRSVRKLRTVEAAVQLLKMQKRWVQVEILPV